VSATSGDTMSGLIAEKPFGIDNTGLYIPMEYQWNEKTSSLDLVYNKSVLVFNEKVTIENGIDEKTGLFNKLVYDDVPITYPIVIDPTWTSASGCWTNISGSYTVIMWNTTGTSTWTVPSNVTSVELLVVGGGGSGGGTFNRGGGGAGGLVHNNSYNISGTITVVVGAGGAGVDGGTNKGSNSSFDVITGIGGGYGAYYGPGTGGPGGSGGGGYGASGATGGATTQPTTGLSAGNGSAGGTGQNTDRSGGGGGAGGAGSANGTNDYGGDGGAGLQFNITGEDLWYAGGGGGSGGGSNHTGGSGGSGVGGTGSWRYLRPVNSSGVNGTGSGGGGGYDNGGLGYAGGSGGSGVVILKYLTPIMPPIPQVASFTANVTSGIAPQGIIFNDTSNILSITSWQWNFTNVTGNNTPTTFSTTNNVTYTFGIGNWSIKLNVTNSSTSNISTQVTFINVSARITDGWSVYGDHYIKYNGTNVIEKWNATGSKTWSVPTDVNSVELLVVGGGGSGGGYLNRGGGGAGGLVHNNSYNVSGTITVVVGTGGAGGAYSQNSGTFSAFDSVIGNGGGGGAGGTGGNGVAGGSGGGAWGESGKIGGSSTQNTTGLSAGNGTAGANGQSNDRSGGGGGAGHAGYQNSTNTNGGFGGEGLQFNITGDDLWYAAGGGASGGGGGSNWWGVGGSGIGGSGGNSSWENPNENGVNATGSGGGGGSAAGSISGGSGGTGVVIIKYLNGTITAPNSSFTANNTTGYAGALTPFVVQFTDTSTNIPNGWIWNATNVTGNNTPFTFNTSQNAIGVFGIGNFSIILNASNSFGFNNSTQSTFINVSKAPPTANFTVNSTTSTVYPLVVRFNDTSINEPTSWNWSFGDGRWFNTTDTSLKNTTYQYAVAQRYDVNLTVSNSAGSNTSYKYQQINLTSDVDTNVSSWMHMNGTNGATTFIDQQGIAWTTNGNAQISTNTYKYGGASGKFDGNGDYISTPSGSFAFGTGNFTIEFWVNVTSISGADDHIISKTNNARTQGWGLDCTGGNENGWDFYMGNDSAGQTPYFTIPTGVWTHVAVERVSGTLYVYINGNLSAQKAGYLANYDTINPTWIARQQNNYADIYLDEFRISTGNARWRSNFTPPYNQYNGLVETIYPDINPNSTFRYKTDPGGNAYLDNQTQRNRTLQIQNITNTSYVVGQMIYNPLYGYVKSVQLNTSYYASGMTLVSSDINTTEGLITFNISKPTGFSPGTDRASILDYTIAYVNYTDGTDTQDTYFAYGYLINGSTQKVYGIHNFLGTAPVYGSWNFTANFTSNVTHAMVGEPVEFNSTFNGSYPNRWNWSFGDGTFDNGVNSTTTHIYATTGLKTVELTEYLWQNGSVNNTKTRTNYIDVYILPVANFTGSPTMGAAPLSVQFIDTSTGSYDWVNWSYGDGAYENLTYSTIFPTPNSVSAIAINSSEYVYKINVVTDRISIINTSGNVISQWGSTGSGNGQFNNAYGIAVNSSGYVYVADSGNNRIQVFDTNGNYIGQWGSLGSGNGEFNNPTGVTVNVSGYVYVVDSGNNRTQVFDASGTYVTKWGTPGSGDGQFTIAYGIAVNSSGYVYITDIGSHRVQVFDAGGTYVTKWGSAGTGNGEFNSDSSPTGITVNSNGDVYVADTWNNRVQVFDASGTYITQWGTGFDGYTNGKFNRTYGIVINGSGYVYVSDIGSYRVQVFDAGGAYITKFSDDIFFVNHIYTNPSTYNVGLTIGSPSETNTTIKIDYIIVYNALVASFTTNVTSGVNATAVQFNDTSNGGYPPPYVATFWCWTFTDVVGNNTKITFNTGGSSATNKDPVHSFGTGNYSIGLYAVNTGGDSFSTQVTFINVSEIPAPIANFTSNVSSGLFVLPIQFNDTTTLSPTSWNWSFGDGSYSNLQDPVKVFYTGGNFTVILNASNAGGFSYATKYVEIFNRTAAEFTANVTSGLFPLHVGFNVTTPYDNATSWNWSFGDGVYQNSTQNATHIYTSGGTYTVSETATNAYYNNVSTRVNYITIHDTTVSGFTANVTSGLFSLPVNFNVSNANDNATWWNWSFGDGVYQNSTQNATHIYTSGGTYTVTEIAGNPYFANTTTIIDYITVFNRTAAEFTANVTSGLFPLHVGFNVTTPIDNATSWNWSFGDGVYQNSTQNATHVYTSGGTYTVSETATNAYYNNVSTRVNYITIYNVTMAGFTANVTSGNAPLNVGFTVTNVNDNGTQWNWSFGDGSWQNGTTQNATHVYSTDSVFTVTEYISNPYSSNSSTQVNYITVYIPPVASFTVNATSGVEPVTIQFTNTSTYKPTAWNWSFQNVAGNNTEIWFSQVQDPVYIFLVGNYRIRLNASNIGGSNISSQVTFINITAPSLPPYAAFTATPMSGNTPLLVTFTDNSANIPATWWWSFGDGSSSVYTQNTAHTYTTNGNYVVWLNVSNVFGVSNTSKTINVFGTNPIASFTKNNSMGGAPLAVAFTDTSTIYSSGILTWYWRFGDGGVSYLQNPTYTYASTGNYNVNLTIIDPIGSSLSPSQTVYVTGNVSPLVDFVGVPVSSASAPLTVTFTDLSLGTRTGWNWSFGDGNYSNFQNPVYTYNYNGQYTVILIATNGTDSNSTSKIGYINVGVSSGSVTASFIASPTSGNYPLTTTFTDLSICNPVCTGWAWDFNNDGAIDSNAKNPTYTYAAPGAYSPKLIASNGGNSNVIIRPKYINVIDPGYVTPTITPITTPWNPTYKNNNVSVSFILPDQPVDLQNSTYLKDWLQNFTATGNFSVYGFATSLMAPMLHIFGFWIYLIIWGLYLWAVWVRSQDVTLPLIIGILSMGTFGLLFPKESLPVIIIMFVVCGAIIVTKLLKDSI
jgi:PKD repeat protein